ncbi:MAG: ABC transporter ATP-binding protein/permease [Spirochaetaceae bacterium]|jgi:ATP-binding cassette subfamily B protein|nr:ABC transporter ATP-binding protein/permease [Spirochaetaceae bacterium]
MSDGMSDYFDQEEVVKDYDSVIFKRILAYIKPYRHLAVITFIALAVSTVGELLLPVLEQRIIDDAIVARYLAVDAAPDTWKNVSARAAGELENLSLGGGLFQTKPLKINGTLFVPQNQQLRISGAVEKELRAKHILDDEQWYAFSLNEKNSSYVFSSPLFIHDENSAAVKNSLLKTIPADKLALVRGADLDRISGVILILLVSLLLVFAAAYVQTWSANLIGQRVMKDMRLELFQKTVSQSTGFLSRHPVGRIVTRLGGDVETINDFFTSVMVALLKDISVMAGALITLFLLSPRLALVVLACMPPVIICTARSRVRARDAFRRQRTASSAVTSYLSERLSGLQIVQYFRRERKSTDEYGRLNDELLSANLGEIRVYAIFRPIVEFIATFTTAALIAVGSILVLNLTLSIGVLIAFINLVAMFYAPVMDISEKYTILQSAMAGGERVFALLDTDQRIPDEGKREISRIRGHIEFKNVSFSYKSGEDVLKNLSFEVKPGEMAAIVGYTGAGKTTITSVLTRLWDIDSGGISLDGIDIREITLESLRREVLPVLQDVFLFSGTIAENITLGLDLPPAEAREAAIAAAKAVRAHDFITRHDAGYDTPLSEGAANISGGERQLISFARVIAHNPSVVVLDEATSSIDTETEQLIQAGMERVLSGRTSIVIAHRLSTIRNAARILVLKGGAIAEQGRHDELIALNGLYAGLYRLQFQPQPAGLHT